MATSGAPPWLQARYTFTGVTLGGGQGAVHVCKDTILDRVVAVKSIHDVKDLDALKKEIQGRAKIQSKHVAEIYECIYEKTVPVGIVIEFVPGETLQDPNVMPGTLDDKLKLLYQIASGISDIHDAKVIHRDIKPLNMKVDGAGVLKIFDLGISNLDADAASTVGGAGTIVYCAPEIYTAPVTVTTAADVYAFGVLGWFVLVGAFPPALVEIPPQSVNPLPSLETAVPGMKEVTDLFDRALAIDPARRPSASEIKDALRRRLTHAKRRATFSLNTAIHILDKMGSATRIEIKPQGMLRVSYVDGIFAVSEVDGAVFVNNVPAAIDSFMPDSCVITFGASGQRVFVTFDVSQPEIVI